MKRLHGFSLLETLFAAGLLCVVFFVILSMYPTSLVGQRKARDMVSATDIAARQLETSKAIPFEQLTPGTSELAPVVINGTTFTPRVEVIEVSAILKKVKVRVTWDNMGATSGQGPAVELETQVYHFVHS